MLKKQLAVSENTLRVRKETAHRWEMKKAKFFSIVNPILQLPNSLEKNQKAVTVTQQIQNKITRDM